MDFTAVFLDSNALIETSRLDDIDSLPFSTPLYVLGWRTIKELDRQKSRAGFRGERCREVLRCAATARNGSFRLGQLNVLIPERPVTRREVEEYRLDPEEADDWLMVEAERFRSQDTNKNRVGILTADQVLLLKLARIPAMNYISGIELPCHLASGHARRKAVKAGTDEERRVRDAIKELMDSVKACLHGAVHEPISLQRPAGPEK